MDEVDSQEYDDIQEYDDSPEYDDSQEYDIRHSSVGSSLSYRNGSTGGAYVVGEDLILSPAKVALEETHNEHGIMRFHNKITKPTRSSNTTLYKFEQNTLDNIIQFCKTLPDCSPNKICLESSFPHARLDRNPARWTRTGDLYTEGTLAALDNRPLDYARTNIIHSEPDYFCSDSQPQDAKSENESARWTLTDDLHAEGTLGALDNNSLLMDQETVGRAHMSPCYVPTEITTCEAGNTDYMNLGRAMARNLNYEMSPM